MFYFNSNCKPRLQTTVKNIFHDALVKAQQKLPAFTAPDVYCTRSILPPVATETVTGSARESGVIICRILTLKINKNELESFFLHELNHICRGQLFSVKQDPTLFNCMLFEGLAETFEQEFKLFPSSLSPCPTKRLLKSGLREILAIGDSNDWNYDDWFYNFDRRSSYPINYAYYIGEWLVNSFCKAQQISPNQAIEITPDVFWQFAETLCA